MANEYYDDLNEPQLRWATGLPNRKMTKGVWLALLMFVAATAVAVSHLPPVQDVSPVSQEVLNLGSFYLIAYLGLCIVMTPLGCVLMPLMIFFSSMASQDKRNEPDHRAHSGCYKICKSALMMSQPRSAARSIYRFVDIVLTIVFVSVCAALGGFWWWWSSAVIILFFGEFVSAFLRWISKVVAVIAIKDWSEEFITKHSE